MTQTIFIVAAIIVVAVLLYRPAREKAVGICASALEQTVRKQGNKQKVLALLAERGEASNSDIREALGVGDRTVVRYMNELEKESRVEQVGKIGRGVAYRGKT